MKGVQFVLLIIIIWIRFLPAGAADVYGGGKALKIANDSLLRVLDQTIQHSKQLRRLRDDT